MLLNLLPGIRELRTPLASGSPWVLFVWVIVGDDVPEFSKATGLLGRLYELSSFLGKPAVLGALIFCCYLVGAVLQIPRNGLIVHLLSVVAFGVAEVVARLMGDYGDLLSGYRWLHEGQSARNTRLAARLTPKTIDTFAANFVLKDAADDDRRTLSGQTLRNTRTARTLQLLLADTGELSTRLHAANTDLYQEHDRGAAEADFRINTGIALTFLLVAAAVSSSAYFLAAVPLSGLLVIRGLARNREANDVLFLALALGIIDSPVVYRDLRRIAHPLRTVRDESPPDEIA
ncbi:hypothetical protein ACWDWT_12390 [Streptomyces sp. NPDC003343]